MPLSSKYSKPSTDLLITKSISSLYSLGNGDKTYFSEGLILRLSWAIPKRSLKNDSDLNFDYLMCITSLDLEENGLLLAYNIHSTKFKNSIEFNIYITQCVY